MSPPHALFFLFVCFMCNVRKLFSLLNYIPRENFRHEDFNGESHTASLSHVLNSAICSSWSRSFQAKGIMSCKNLKHIPGDLLFNNTKKNWEVLYEPGSNFNFLLYKSDLAEKQSFFFFFLLPRENSNLDSSWNTVNIKKAHIVFIVRKGNKMGFSRGREMQRLRQG